MLSEAMDLVVKMVGAFPNGGTGAGKGYLGALASILVTYPRSVASQCADPIKGVSRECKFLPTIADIVSWCEKETEEMRRPVERADRDEMLAAQRRARAAEDAEMQDKRGRRPTMDELRAKHGPNWGIKDSGAKIQPTKEESRQALIAQIGQEAFDALPDGKDRADDYWKKVKYRQGPTYPKESDDWVKAEFPPGSPPPSEVP